MIAGLVLAPNRTNINKYLTLAHRIVKRNLRDTCLKLNDIDTQDVTRLFYGIRDIIIERKFINGENEKTIIRTQNINYQSFSFYIKKLLFIC